MRKTKSLSLSGLAACAIVALGLGATPQAASAQPAYTGEIFPVGFNFCPRGTAALNGQILAISSNAALFSLLGSNYGGDGRTTFALPDMRGRSPMHVGVGPGLTPRPLAQKSGADSVVLTTNNLPSHNHLVGAQMVTATKRGPGTDLYAIPSDDVETFSNGPADTAMDPAMIHPTGNGQPLQVVQPFLAVNWCMNLYGLFPSRN